MVRAGVDSVEHGTGLSLDLIDLMARQVPVADHGSGPFSRCGTLWIMREDPCCGCPRASSSSCLSRAGGREGWVEAQPDLQPGGRAVVRLAPLSPQRWRRLATGDVITMHEQRPAAGIATIVESVFPIDNDQNM